MSRQVRATAKSPAMPPARRQLSREKVVAGGIALIDKQGVDTFSMRTLAETLSVTPMALYNHFSSKHAVLLAIADGMIGDTEFDGGKENWREQTHHCLAAVRHLCLRHPSLPKLLQIEGAAPAGAFAPMGVVVNALGQAGLPATDSMRAYFTLISFALMQASYQSGSPFLQPSGQPPEAWDFDGAFEFGLGLILDGIDQALGRANS